MRSEASKARQNAYYKEWYQKNKEKINLQHSRWQKENSYYEKNKERIIKKAKEYYYSHKSR